MDNWLLIFGAIILISVILIVYYYFFKYLKPIPKPRIEFQELKDPPDKVKFTIFNHVNNPAIVDYLVHFEVLFISNGKTKKVVIREKSIIPDKSITRESSGEWEFENFLDDLRIEEETEIDKMGIKILFKDSDGRKYCYCGFFNQNIDGYWKAKEFNEYYIRYKYWKCIFCLFKERIPPVY